MIDEIDEDPDEPGRYGATFNSLRHGELRVDFGKLANGNAYVDLSTRQLVSDAYVAAELARHKIDPATVAPPAYPESIVRARFTVEDAIVDGKPMVQLTFVVSSYIIDGTRVLLPQGGEKHIRADPYEARLVRNFMRDPHIDHPGVYGD
jgi:hypothetical protein